MKKSKADPKVEAKPETKPEKAVETKEPKAEKPKGENPAVAKYLVGLKNRRPDFPVATLKESKTKGAAQRAVKDYLQSNNIA